VAPSTRFAAEKIKNRGHGMRPMTRSKPADLLATARDMPEAVYAHLETAPNGLDSALAAVRLQTWGRNEIAAERRRAWPWRLLATLRDPLNVLLAVLASLSWVTHQIDATVMIAGMVVLSASLRFVQETRATSAAAALRAMIHITATAMRDGMAHEVPVAELVPGDVVHLAAGDMVPADVRLVACKDLFLNQAALTGESFPVEKSAAALPAAAGNPLDLANLLFLGTSVVSGTAQVVVVRTGRDTTFGGMAASIVDTEVETSFDRGIRGVTWLMIRFMMVLAPLVFVINGAFKHQWQEALFFALAVSVGLTPEMLPMIVTVCLSKGALAMSRQRVIVKRLEAIQNLGAMDVLCTDKTGTLTRDEVILEKHCDVMRRESADVLRLAYLNSAYQTGLKNVLDRAILEHENLDIAKAEKVDEIPFDFMRRLMSVVVRIEPQQHRLVTKGAPEAVFPRCRRFELDGELLDIGNALLPELEAEYRDLSSDGFRVLAVAYRDFQEPKAAYSKDDEHDLVLAGYVAFLDPPKESAAAALAALHRGGVRVKLLTGDNELVTRNICQHVGLEAAGMLLGSDIEALDDGGLAAAAENVAVFARVSPAHKERIVRALRAAGHVVGFMGDGINDAPALKAADVGISVDTAVDIAKESADIILLEKSLMVLQDGVIEGRRTFANIVKYIKMGASSNFGNMFSVVGASALLPFLPMQPLQVLANNLLYDFSQVPIPTDAVDPEDLRHPRRWELDRVKKFMFLFGPISSIFDYTTFAILWFVFHAANNPRLFQTGWFVESLLTQTLIIHIIRTNKIPFVQSRASAPLLATTAAIMAVGIILPYTPLAGPLQFTPLPLLYWPLLVLTLLGYALLTHAVKSRLVRKGWV
jgi:Mg2+-importing ATPase